MGEVKPIRLKLSRAKGFNLQEHSLAANGLPAVRVARPGLWGNPHKVGADETYYGGPGHEQATAAQCVELYRRHLEAGPYGLPAVETLRGHNLACWCGLSDPCHADVLLELANGPLCDEPRAPTPSRQESKGGERA